MSGFPGRISFEGDDSDAVDLTRVAIKFAEQLHAWKQTQGITDLVRAFDLGDGRYCVVADLQNMRALHIVSPISAPLEFYFPDMPEYELEALGVIDVISGKNNSPRIVSETITVDNKPRTVTVLKDFTATTPTSARFTDLFRRSRLAVDRSEIFSDDSDVRWSEHFVKPSQFTGAMRKVVQLILGVGRIQRPTWEELWVELNDKSLLATDEDLPVRSAFGLYEAVSNTAPQTMRLEFDYRFGKTHGITFDMDNKPWVVEISTRGVHVMPLYMDPVSQTVAGRARYLEVSPELTAFFEEFNGMPIGMTIPTGETFTIMKNAGEIRELLSAEDMSRFYDKSGYCSEHGWAFNSRGTEAHNTCFTYDEKGLGVGSHFSINLRVLIDAIPDWTDDTLAVASVLGLTKFYERNKARRLRPIEASQVLSIYDRDGIEDAKKKFDEIVVQPTIGGSATLTELRKGRLYHPARRRYQPQIKYPEPLVGGLISHDFGRLEGSVHPPVEDQLSNTPMFVTYIDDNLEVVYYFYDPRSRPSSPAYTTRQRCQFVGEWEEGSGTVEPKVQGNFYSTVWDWRQLVGRQASVSRRKGEKVGDYNVASTDAFFSICITVTKYRVFQITSVNTEYESRSLDVSVAMPQGDRSCFYMCRRDGVVGQSITEFITSEQAIGGRTDHYRLYNFVFHWVGRCGTVEEIVEEFPLRCRAKLRGYTYIRDSCFTDLYPDPMEYSVCYAPDGQSIGVTSSWSPAAIIGDATFPPEPVVSGSQRLIQPATNKYQGLIRMISDSGHGDIKVKEVEVAGQVLPDDLPVSFWWWIASPDEGGGVATLNEVHSCLGEDVMNYMDDLDGYPQHLGGPEEMHGSLIACYTGVIQ